MTQCSFCITGLRNWKAGRLCFPLGRRSQIKTKPKENGKCKAGIGWKQENKAIKINYLVAVCDSLNPLGLCWKATGYTKGYIILYLSCFLNAFPKYFPFVIAIEKLLDWLNPMVAFNKLKTSNKKPNPGQLFVSSWHDMAYVHTINALLHLKRLPYSDSLLEVAHTNP